MRFSVGFHSRLSASEISEIARLNLVFSNIIRTQLREGQQPKTVCTTQQRQEGVMANLKSTAKEGPTMLLFGRMNNFMSWKSERLNVCCKEFGFLANVLKTNEPYLPEAVQPIDYMPAVAQEGIEPLPALGAAAIAALRLEAEKQRNKIISKLKSDAPRLYATLWETISLESKEEIRQHVDYEDADLTQNPNILWTIIVETHVTAIHGAGPEMRELEIVTLKTKFNAIRQRSNMTIGEFKKEFDDQIDVITGAGVEPMPQPELAILFLTKLDPTRYAPMMAQLTNNATLGIPFPQTLHAAWTISSGWKAASLRQQGGGEMHSVFILADDDRKEGGRERGRGGRGRGRGQRGAGGRPDQKRPLQAPDVVENRTCRGCLIKGHLWANCPDNPDKMSAMVVTDEPDYEDHMSTYDAAFICTTGEEDAVILFTNDDVLLDNQASRSLFKNCKLLTTIEQAASPFYIGGIDSSSRGLLVKQQGCFHEYGNVAFQPNAAANVISVAEALNRGCSVTYSSPEDAYTLGVCGRDYVFSRKFVSGRLSSHYTWANTIDTALITTVANNMRNYTPREVSQARAARELMLNLGHASSTATIDMLDSGILNCAVTKTDVRNADAIFGPSVPSLKGKTVKRTSRASPNIVAPRVTQVEQIIQELIPTFFARA